MNIGIQVFLLGQNHFLTREKESTKEYRYTEE